MIRLHDVHGTLHQFDDAEAIVAHFALDLLPDDALAGIRAASDANFPLHAAIDPYTQEIREMRVLILEPTAHELRTEMRTRREDV